MIRNLGFIGALSVVTALAPQLFLSPAFLPQVSAFQDLDSKRPLEHKDYEKWNSVQGQSLSPDGKWAMYTVANEKTGSTLYIRQLSSSKEYSVKFGSGGRFTDDSSHAIYYVNPDPKVVEKLQKEKSDNIPSRKLEILNLKDGKHETIENVTSFTIPQENSDWLAIRFRAPKKAETVKAGQSSVKEEFEVTEEGLQRPEKPKKFAEKETEAEPEAAENKSKSKENQQAGSEGKAGEKKSAGKKKKEKSNGSPLALRNLKTDMERRFPDVTNFSFSKKGEVLVYTSSGEKPEEDGVFLFDLAKQKKTQIISGLGNYSRLAINLDGTHVAFLSDRDDYEAEQPSWSLYHWKKGQKAAKLIAKEGHEGVPAGWWIASSATPSFSEDNKRLFFSTRIKPDDVGEDKKENKDEEKKAVLDIWHWQDPQLQPQQKLQVQTERNRSYRAVYDLKSKKVFQLADTDIPNVLANPRSPADVAIANTNVKYMKMLSWDIPGYQDSYLVNLSNGKRELIHEAVKFSSSLSPDGKFVSWFDAEEKHWFAMSVKDRKPVKISEGIEFPLYNELHDTPSLPRSYGSVGWLNDDKAILIYDRFDIWQLDPTGKEDPICVTAGKGRESNTRYRYVRLDFEQRSIDPQQPMMLSVFNFDNKSSGFSTIAKAGEDIEQLIQLDESVGRLNKAKYADNVLFTRSTFQKYPDVWHSTTSFKKISRISRANPQQSDYVWGTAELVKWNSKTGEELDGLLYKPENFDPDKKYPLMVYFYERNSDNLHSYYTPSAGRSIINFSFYVSRGYVIFVPDIPYRTGEPGPSAADAILPGVQSIVDKGFVDEEKIGLQGHSWGGYQIAYLVTVTDMFACAESGAPVSNMTSAYGGIRWGTGMSRMFQYERTQSRIGETLWEARDKYIANSPVFFADKINTPLLILHNDKDTAVPWYQGIELFVAMRRLSKPCWMLNYNEDPHWVMSDENRMDFAKRMQQFFDHYMLDEPMPVWMDSGIPAVDKGEEFGFEYVRPEQEGEVVENAEGESGAEQNAAEESSEEGTGESSQEQSSK